MGDEPGLPGQTGFSGSLGPEGYEQAFFAPSTPPISEAIAFSADTTTGVDNDQVLPLSCFAPEYWQTDSLAFHNSPAAPGESEESGWLEWLRGYSLASDTRADRGSFEPGVFQHLNDLTSWLPSDTWLNPTITEAAPNDQLADAVETAPSSDDGNQNQASFLGSLSLRENDRSAASLTSDAIISLFRSFGILGELLVPAASTSFTPGFSAQEGSYTPGEPRGGFGNFSDKEMEDKKTGRWRTDLKPVTWLPVY